MARYSLRSQGFTSIGNLHGTSQRTLPEHLQHLNPYFPKSSSATMSYDGDHVSLPFNSSTCNTAGSTLSIPSSEIQWDRPQNSGALCNESYPFLSIENDYENHHGSTYRRAHNARTFEDYQWNNGLSPHHSSITYSCPRAFVQEVDSTVRTTTGSISPNHPPAAYSINPFDCSTHPAMALYQNFESNLTTLREEQSGLNRSNETFQSYPPALSRSLSESTRPDIGPIATPDVNKIDSRGTSQEVAIESDGDGSVTSEPYAQLIYRALMSTPEHKMVLREIYEWFEKYTDKAKTKGSKGWQNSIRHNLSMNGVSFEG